jgi:hypothetical protein
MIVVAIFAVAILVLPIDFADTAGLMGVIVIARFWMAFMTLTKNRCW